jgi:hypothetical protein
MDQEIVARGKRLFIAVLEKCPQQPDAVSIAFILFFKLLAADETILILTPQLLTILGNLKTSERNLVPWLLIRCVLEVPLNRLVSLIEFTRHKDRRIRQGALVLWEALVESILDGPRYYPHIDATRLRTAKSLRFDWKLALSLVDDAESTNRKRGITLLTLSDFPSADTTCRAELLDAMAKAREDSEIKGWAQLLREIPISKPEEAGWRELLELVLAQPRTYSLAILTAAMERYSALVGPAGPHIIGDEAALGLPAVGRI